MARDSAMVMNEQTPAREKFIYYVVGFCFTAYFAILCGSAWTPDCSFNEWLSHFTEFVIEQHHYIVGFTSATPMFIGVYEAIWTLGYLYYITQFQHPFAGREHGDARWGDIRSFSKEYGNHDDNNLVEVNFGKDVKPPKKPVYVNTHNYWVAEGCYINLDNELTSNLNFLVIGPPGTGKSFRLARPVLSQLSGNFLVTDPKGELSRQTGQFFEDNGYQVFVLNVESEEGMKNSIHFNPFRYLRNESDILSLVQIMFKSTKDPEAQSGGDNQFFEDMAQTLLTDIFYLMHYTYPDDQKDWRHFVELLESTTVKSNPKTGGIDNSDPNGILNRFEEANKKWLAGAYTKDNHGNPIPQEENLKGLVDIRKIYTGAQETSSSIVSSLDAHCKYMKLDCVKELLSEDEIDITNSFGYCKKSKASPTGKHILFIVTSEDKRYYDWITSMVYSLFFDDLYHLTAIDETLEEHLPIHLTFLMDEFANVTLPDSFVEKLSTMRSREMSAIVIVQNLRQLEAKFPNHSMDKNLIGNMAVIDILGAPDWDSCEYLSKHFGTMTIHKKTTGTTKGSQGSHSENEDVMQMPLFAPEKMFKMKKDGPCAIVVKGTDPLWVRKCQFQHSPLLPLLTRKKNPYKMKRFDDTDDSMKYDYNKSPCEQIMPKIYMNEEADEVLKKCEEEGKTVVRFTKDDIENLMVLERHGLEPQGNDASTNEYWEQIRKQSEAVVKEKALNELNFDDYDENSIMTVQRLKNNGFTGKQIHAIDPLLSVGVGFDEIISYFSATMTAEEISSFATRLANIKRKEKT